MLSGHAPTMETHPSCEKEARSGARKLSQWALSAKVGLPQGHISRVEAGEVDLKLSSLVGLAPATSFRPDTGDTLAITVPRPAPSGEVSA